ncbi:hypothetical protein ACFQ1I_03200 [Kitasatospora arboriphila]
MVRTVAVRRCIDRRRLGMRSARARGSGVRSRGRPPGDVPAVGGSGHGHLLGRRRTPMAWILFLVLLAIVLGLIGVAAHGLLYLLFIGIVVLLVAVALGGARFRRSGWRPTR